MEIFREYCSSMVIARVTSRKKKSYWCYPCDQSQVKLSMSEENLFRFDGVDRCWKRYRGIDRANGCDKRH